jgi:hypothetical protein
MQGPTLRDNMNAVLHRNKCAAIHIISLCTISVACDSQQDVTSGPVSCVHVGSAGSMHEKL